MTFVVDPPYDFPLTAPPPCVTRSGRWSTSGSQASGRRSSLSGDPPTGDGDVRISSSGGPIANAALRVVGEALDAEQT